MGENTTKASENLPILLQKSLNVYGQKYLFKQDCDDCWITKHETLTPGIVLGHFQGKHTVGYFSTPQTQWLVIDLDLHDVQQSAMIDHVLQVRYQIITQSIGIPSFVVRSSESMGLHIYYRLSSPYYFKGIKQSALNLLGNTERALKKAGIEFSLSTTHGIAFPFAKNRGGLFLNPKTLQVLYEIRNPQDAINHIINAPVSQSLDLHIREIYNDLRPERTNAKEQKQNIKKQSVFYTKAKKLEVEQGNTDGYIYHCARIGYFCHMEISIVASFISEELFQNGITIKRDTNDGAISNRVRSHYQRFRKDNEQVLNFKPKTPQLDLFEQVIIKKVLEHPLILEKVSKRRMTSLKTFLEHLYQWDRYIKGLSHLEAHEVDFCYRLFYFYTKKKGWIPLPKSLMRRWNDYYFPFISLLQEIGLVSIERHAYNPFEQKQQNNNVKGICAYYSLKWALFDELRQSPTT